MDSLFRTKECVFPAVSTLPLLSLSYDSNLIAPLFLNVRSSSSSDHFHQVIVMANFAQSVGWLADLSNSTVYRL